MGDFFHGWRHKVGCVTLMMAAVFFGAWMRSSLVYDQIAFTVGERQHEIFSVDGWLLWHSTGLDINEEGYKGWMAGTAESDPSYVHTLFLVQRFGHFAKWIAPYWCLVCPLAVLSAILILWPGKRKAKRPQSSEAAPTRIIEPISDERA